MDPIGRGDNRHGALPVEVDEPVKSASRLKRVVYLLRDVAVALFVIGTCVALYRWGILPLLQVSLPLTDVQLTILRRVGVTASLFLAYWAVAHFYERRAITELAFRPIAISAGAFFGIALIGMTILLLYALGNYRLLSFRGVAAALPILSLILFAAAFEEILFRGVVFRLLEHHTGTIPALITQAVLFGGLHLFNEGTSAMTVVSVTLIGAFWTVVYVYSRNLWVVIANHAAWNGTIFISGLPLSGQEAWRASAPLESSYQGPVWWTGGEFGPEDSIINIVVMACVFGGVAYRAWKQGAFRPSTPPGA